MGDGFSPTSRLAISLSADGSVRWNTATRSKVLKVIKVLNFSGAGMTNIFTCTFTFTGWSAEEPDPAALGLPLLGDGDALGLACGTERAAPDPPFTGFVSQLPGETGAGGERLP
jgi:hypothetical protein